MRGQVLRLALAAGAFAAALAFAQDKQGATAPGAEPTAPAAEAPVAGLVDFVEGDAMFEGRNGMRIAKVGDSVRSGETATTFAAAEVHLKMADGAYLSLRENSKITITSYVANGDEGDESLIELARGAFRSVTGWIGKFRPKAYKVTTPMATIGIRGTDHEPTHLLPGDPRGEPGTYDKVNEGSTVLRSPRGTVEVTPNRAAFFNTDRREPPRVLASVPKFFQPARNEQRFAQRARESARTVETQRAQHIEAVRKERGRPAAKPPAQARPATRAPETAQKAIAPRAVPQQPAAAPKPAAQKPAAMREKAERRAEARRQMEQRQSEKARPRPEIQHDSERQRPAGKARRQEEAEERHLEKGTKKRR
jgi:hypothetical protein